MISRREATGRNLLTIFFSVFLAKSPLICPAIVTRHDFVSCLYCRVHSCKDGAIMNMDSRQNYSKIVALLLLVFVAGESVLHAADWRFEVKFDKTIHSDDFTGRVYVIFSRTKREPRTGPGWFNPEMFVSRDVEKLKPGEPVLFTGAAPGDMLAYPGPLAKFELKGFRAQAVVRFNPYERKIGTGAGNGYSQVISIKAQQAEATPLFFTVDKLVTPRKFANTKFSKLLRVRSKLLSEFHGRGVFLKAAVSLPASYYDEPDRRYPSIWNIPGFGGTHLSGRRNGPVREENEQGVEFLRLMLDPSCPLGHHVFADSANNGPVGAALVSEFIPAFDRKFRSIAAPTARFLTGHSSGGWSSLWLQVTYSEHFGGTWSTSPDPVDFRDFQRINLYSPGENMYLDNKGNKRPLARRGDQVTLWYKGFADMEWTLGPGGQLHSFEAAFSPRGKDGKPLLVWDRKTGEVHTEVAKTWEKYDIRLILERNWKTLGPKLTGKLHVIMGDGDTFYLEGATKLLKKSLADLNSDAIVELVPGKDHFNLFRGGLAMRIRREMVSQFLQHHPPRNE